MELAAHAVDAKSLAESATATGASYGQPFVPPAVPGDLSDPKEESMDQASAVTTLATADYAWNYASLGTLDCSLTPPPPPLQHFHAWRFGSRFAFQQHRRERIRS